jgi:tRNA G18 (ribose-2'-O)-methylase SpoU
MAETRLLVGFHAVTARLRQRPESVRTLYVARGRQDARARDLLQRAQAAGTTIHPVDDRRLEELARGERHQGVVAVVDATLPHVTLAISSSGDSRKSGCSTMQSAGHTSRHCGSSSAPTHSVQRSGSMT